MNRLLFFLLMASALGLLSCRNEPATGQRMVLHVPTGAAGSVIVDGRRTRLVREEELSRILEDRRPSAVHFKVDKGADPKYVLALGYVLQAEKEKLGFSYTEEGPDFSSYKE